MTLDAILNAAAYTVATYVAVHCIAAWWTHRRRNREFAARRREFEQRRQSRQDNGPPR